VNDSGAILANPVTALMAAALCALSVRFFVAWSVFLRIRGWGPSGANLHPRRVRSDYPRPNDPVVAGVILLIGWIVFWIVVTVVGPLPDREPAVASWVGRIIFFGAAIVSVIYAVRRLREDDRRQRRALANRLAAESDQRLS
jgi:hypothetical protein